MNMGDPWNANGGSVDFSGEHEQCQNRPLIWARLLAVMIGLPVMWAILIPKVALPGWQAAVVVVGGTLIYVAIAYLVDPQPDFEGTGPLGCVMDNPYTFTDNITRFLMGLKCVLGPGRFIAESIFDAGVLFRSDPQEQETV